jgi:hypothetical protein
LNTSRQKLLKAYRQGHTLLDRLVSFAPDKVVHLRDELDCAWSRSEYNELLIIHQKALLLLKKMKEN